MINNNKCRHQVPVIKTKIPLKYRALLGSDNRGAVYLDSYVNRLTSGYLRQYNNVPSQCKWLPWTWMWHLLYWSLISFREAYWYYLVCYVQAIITTTRGLLKLSYLSAKWFTVYCYLFPFYSHYQYLELLWMFLFIISQDTLEEVHSPPFSVDLKLYSYFRYGHINLSLNIDFLKKISNLFLCGIFEHNFFRSSQRKP